MTGRAVLAEKTRWRTALVAARRALPPAERAARAAALAAAAVRVGADTGAPLCRYLPVGSRPGAPELVTPLLARPTPLLRTFTTNLMAYALGRRVEYFDQPAIRAVVREAEEHDYRLSSFILGVVLSDQFRLRTAAPAAANQ